MIKRGHLARAFPTMLRVGLAEMVAYRSELVIWILTASAPVIMLLVWDGVAAGGSIKGYDQPAFARYFTAGLVVRQLTSAWVVWELNHEIRTGALSPALLKPMHPLVLRAAENLVAIPFRILVLIPLVAALWLWRPEMGMPLTLEGALLLPLSLALGWAMNFLVQVAFGAVAFWVDQSLGLFNVWFALWALLSGYLFPLSLLPGPLAQIAILLPFRSMLATPTEIAAGQLTGPAALQALALQTFWTLVFFAIARATWNRGVRHYEAFGA
ncbi:MAG: ABC-2 family transporter protein [Myxococcales bacterium]|nr:ABC-2 family transporter protein [Myxococcales bacterium]